MLSAWTSLPIRDELEPKEAHMLQKCSKLDPTNGPQMTLLVDKLASSTHLINFWLRRCVFPKDMAQCPARIATSAWNLAHTARAKGFSGTNESNPIMPVQIVPKEPPLPELLATNGLMLDSLMTHTVAVHALAKGDAWKVVVDFVLAGGYDALILTRGPSWQPLPMPRSAITCMLHHDDFDKFRAIVNFDPSKDARTRTVVLLNCNANELATLCIASFAFPPVDL